MRRRLGAWVLLGGMLLSGAVTAQGVPTAVPPTTAQADTVASGPLLTLDEALNRARRQNIDLQQAQIDVEVATNNATYGAAGLLPGAGLSASQARRPGEGDLGGSTYDLALSASYTVFDGFERLALARQARAFREQVTALARSTEEALVATITAAYYGLVQQQEAIEVQQQTIAISEERLRIAEGRARLGAASELEVNRARVDLNADRAGLLRLRANLADAKAAFLLLLNDPAPQPFRVEDTIPLDRSLDLASLQVEAQRRNPDLAARDAAVAASEQALRAARAAWWPSVGVTAGYVFNGVPETLGLEPSRRDGFTFGVTASLPLFDGFERRRRAANARLLLEDAQLERTDAEAAIATGLRRAFARYQSSLDLLTLERENVALAERNTEVALARFRLGASTALELREVQLALADARSRLLIAEVEAKQAEITINLLAGALDTP